MSKSRRCDLGSDSIFSEGSEGLGCELLEILIVKGFTNAFEHFLLRGGGIDAAQAPSCFEYVNHGHRVVHKRAETLLDGLVLLVQDSALALDFIVSE